MNMKVVGPPPTPTSGSWQVTNNGDTITLETQGPSEVVWGESVELEIPEGRSATIVYDSATRTSTVTIS